MYTRQAIINSDIPNISWDKINKYSLLDNEFLSIFYFAFSTLITVGESNVKGMMKILKDEIEDESFKKDINIFIEQEINHSRFHNKYNKIILEHIPVKDFVKRRNSLATNLTKKYHINQKDNFKLHAYRAYIAEELTDQLCKWFYSSGLLDRLPNQEKNIFGWHLVEEIEHNPLTKKVLSYFGNPNLFHRTERSFKSLFGFVIEVLFRTFFIAWKDGLLKKSSCYKGMFEFFFTYKYFPKLVFGLFTDLFIGIDIYKNVDIDKILKRKPEFLRT